MRLSVMTPGLYHLNLPTALDFLVEEDVAAVEVGVGGYPGSKHCQIGDRPVSVEELLKSTDLRQEWLDQFESRSIAISAFAVHNNPVDPKTENAELARREFHNAIMLATACDVQTLVGFSGCAGGPGGGTDQIWSANAWPPEHRTTEEWQWKECLEPYWREEARVLADHGRRVAIEIHPGMQVHNVSSMLRLCDLGESIGANPDLSHMLWRGMKPRRVFEKLSGRIYHFHGKDCRTQDTAEWDGIIDTRSFTDLEHRAWIFVRMGAGHDEVFWSQVFADLRVVGHYDGDVSIEHEDGTLGTEDGLLKAIRFTKPLIPVGPLPEGLAWA